MIATAGSEDGGTYGSNIGKAEYVLDNDVTTAWMTAYSGYATTIKNGEGWIDLQFPEHIQLTDFVICQDRLQLEPWLQLLIMRFMLRQQIQRIM